MTDTPQRYTTDAGAILYMTAEQAARWNLGILTPEDTDSIICNVVTFVCGIESEYVGTLRECRIDSPEAVRDTVTGRLVQLEKQA
jgi:hypothetical protein